MKYLYLLIILCLCPTHLLAKPTAEEKARVKSAVESAYTKLEAAYHKAMSGKLTHGLAKKEALKQISEMRFGSNNYFFAFDPQLRMVMHPIKPSLKGKDLSSLTDPQGKLLFKEFFRAAKGENEGYVTYHWPMPGVSMLVEKVSYLKYFEPWKVVIGTGLNVASSEVCSLREKFVTALAFIELYKIQNGIFPKSVQALSSLATSIPGKFDGISYTKSEQGYILNFDHIEQSQSNIIPLKDLTQGTGLLHTNLPIKVNKCSD